MMSVQRKGKKLLLEKLAGSEPHWKHKRLTEFKTEEEAKAALLQAEDSEKTGRRSISESSVRSEESRKCAETGRNPDQPLPAGDSESEEVCGRSQKLLIQK